MVDAAFRQAAQDVVQRAVQSGTPVLFWKDGTVVATDPRQAHNDATAK